jgi:hypothetical protein
MEGDTDRYEFCMHEMGETQKIAFIHTEYGAYDTMFIDEYRAVHPINKEKNSNTTTTSSTPIASTSA